jgi:hypothetical protein
MAVVAASAIEGAPELKDQRFDLAQLPLFGFTPVWFRAPVWNRFKTPFFLLQPAEHFNIEEVPLQSIIWWACRINDRLFL